MFIKENVKIIIAFVIVIFIGGLSFYFLRGDEYAIKESAGQQVTKRPVLKKTQHVPVVVKKYNVHVANIVDDAGSIREGDMAPVDSIPTEPVQVPLNSLADARVNGDPRTPPIVRSSIEREMPTPDELADPELYQEYETRQNQKVYRSFYNASKNKLIEMEALMEKARSQGVPEDKLLEGEEKIVKMKAMREKLAQTYDDIAD